MLVGARVGEVEQAGGGGWSLRRACGLLEVSLSRVLGWPARVDAGASLKDRAPGPTQAPPHALMDGNATRSWPYDKWHEVDRSCRKLTYRSSREDRVHASEASFWRVLTIEGVRPADTAARPGATQAVAGLGAAAPMSVWGYDFSHLVRARRVAIAVLDLVSRYWITQAAQRGGDERAGDRRLHSGAGGSGAAR